MVNRTGSAPVLEAQPLDLSPHQALTSPPHTSNADQAPKSRIPTLSSSAKMRLKLAISLVMFCSLFLFGKIDLSKSIEIALHANVWFLSGAIALYLSSVVLNAYRWQMLASAVGMRRPLAKLIQYCFVGAFFNLFLPSTVGGDFSRCYYISKGTRKYGSAVYSVLADRAAGIAVLFMFATLGLLLGPGGNQLPWQLKAPIFLGTFGIFAVLPFMPVLTRRLLGETNWIARRFNDSSAAVYWQDKKLVAISLLLSILMQVVVVAVHILVGYALGLTTIPLWYYFVFYPSVAVLGFITPSFNGIGIREWAYTYFLTMTGVDRSHALTYAIMWLGLTTFLSLFGGVVYLAGHLKINKEEAERLQLDAA